MPRQDLKTTIQRKLLLRLGLACLVISIALAFPTYIRERDRVSGVVIERSRQSVKRFNIQILPILDDSKEALDGEALER